MAGGSGETAETGTSLNCGIGVYVRVWRVPKLNDPQTGAPGLLVHSGPFDPQCPSPLQVAEPIETTVCDVVAHRQEFIRGRVRLRATVETDCLEHTALTDARCDGGLLPWGAGSPDGDALFDAVCGPSSAGTIDSRAKEAATFTGILRPHGHSPKGAIALEIEKVEDVRPAKGAKDR